MTSQTNHGQDAPVNAPDQCENNLDSISIPVSQSNTVHEADDGCRSHWFKYIFGDIYASDDPNNYSEKRKNVIILLVALGGLCGPLSSMMYMPALLTVAEDLKTTVSAVNGTVSAFVVFMGISPLFWAALSDQYGRKRMYIISGVINVVSCIICAICKNIAMLIVFRGLQSFGANAGLTLGAGVIADTIAVESRGSAYGIFYTGPLVGPVIGPTIGGFLCQYLGWRSTFYFTAILAGVLLLLTTAFLPETLRKQRPDILTDRELIEEFKVQNDRGKQGTIEKHAKPTFFATLAISFKPMLIMLNDPTVNLLTAYNTVIFASLYFLNPTITDTFKTIYGYSEWKVGLCYLSLGGGFMIGSVLSGRHSDYVLAKLSKKSGGRKVVSEMRLQAAIPSFIFIPIGYLIYGWTTEKKIGVYAPLIGLFVYALGQMWAFTPTSVYLVDSKPGYSATAVGINSFVRCIGAAITSIFSSSVVHALGTGVLFSILAAINLLNAGFVLTCYFFGTKWRVRFEEKHMPELLEESIKDKKSNEDSRDSDKRPVENKEMDGQDTQAQRDTIERIETNHSVCYSIA
ncbi:hypothetical protein CU097_009261 [Rhizopus azygosporus]|uniref:Major facilitator superfamily (MFS) profile domain-containing protein n=1 Tax=Rhizopus azygosporus TaxID=86630 RepID=A0A367JNH0_RHIAZ|nr:hypothetical protein CU097_009261 [Rhizopus azygosporus]